MATTTNPRTACRQAVQSCAKHIGKNWEQVKADLVVIALRDADWKAADPSITVAERATVMVETGIPETSYFRFVAAGKASVDSIARYEAAVTVDMRTPCGLYNFDLACRNHAAGKAKVAPDATKEAKKEAKATKVPSKDFEAVASKKVKAMDSEGYSVTEIRAIVAYMAKLVKKDSEESAPITSADLPITRIPAAKQDLAKAS